MQFAKQLSPRKKPTALSAMMGRSKSEPVQSTYGSSDYGLQKNGHNYYDTDQFRNTLTEGPKGNWYNKQSNVFEDGTMNPKTGVRTPSNVHILDQGGVPVPNQAKPLRQIMGNSGRLFQRNR